MGPKKVLKYYKINMECHHYSSPFSVLEEVRTPYTDIGIRAPHTQFWPMEWSLMKFPMVLFGLILVIMLIESTRKVELCPYGRSIPQEVFTLLLAVL